MKFYDAQPISHPDKKPTFFLQLVNILDIPDEIFKRCRITTVVSMVRRRATKELILRRNLKKPNPILPLPMIAGAGKLT